MTETPRPERRMYTAEEFADRAKCLEENWVQDDLMRISVAALRIAANVMRPGLIEEKLRLWTLSNEHQSGAAAAIRAALTEPPPTAPPAG